MVNIQKRSNGSNGSRGNIYGILAWVFLILVAISLYGIFYGNIVLSNTYQLTFLLSPILALIFSFTNYKINKSGYVALMFSVISVMGLIIYLYIGSKID